MKVKQKIKNIFIMFLPNKKSRWGVLALVLVITGFLLYSQSVHAQSLVDEGAKGFVSAGIAFMLWTAQLAIALSVFALRFFIQVAAYNNYVDTPIVHLGWTMIRDVANMFFVLVLLVIAIGTILGIEQYEWKKTLANFILAAVFINFSNLICGLFIDVAHVFTITFLNAVAATAGGNVISLFHMDSIFKMASNNPADAQNSNLTAQLFMAVAASCFFAVVTLVTIGSYLVVMLLRVVVLWALIILSPLAYIMQVIPQTQQYSKQWWEKFGKQVMVAPVMVFFLWLTFATLGNGNSVATINEKLPAQFQINNENSKTYEIKMGSTNIFNDDKTMVGSVNQTTLADITKWENMASFFIAVAFMMVGISVVEQMGVVGGGLVSKGMDFGKSVLAFASGYGTARFLAKEGWSKAKSAGIGAAKSVGKSLAAPVTDRVKLAGLGINKLRAELPGLRKIPYIGRWRKLRMEKMTEDREKAGKAVDEGTKAQMRQEKLGWVDKAGKALSDVTGHRLGFGLVGGTGQSKWDAEEFNDSAQKAKEERRSVRKSTNENKQMNIGNQVMTIYLKESREDYDEGYQKFLGTQNNGKDFGALQNIGQLDKALVAEIRTNPEYDTPEKQQVALEAALKSENRKRNGLGRAAFEKTDEGKVLARASSDKEDEMIKAAHSGSIDLSQYHTDENGNPVRVNPQLRKAVASRIRYLVMKNRVQPLKAEAEAAEGEADKELFGTSPGRIARMTEAEQRKTQAKTAIENLKNVELTLNFDKAKTALEEVRLKIADAKNPDDKRKAENDLKSLAMFNPYVRVIQAEEEKKATEGEAKVAKQRAEQKWDQAENVEMDKYLGDRAARDRVEQLFKDKGGDVVAIKKELADKGDEEGLKVADSQLRVIAAKKIIDDGRKEGKSDDDISNDPANVANLDVQALLSRDKAGNLDKDLITNHFGMVARPETGHDTSRMRAAAAEVGGQAVDSYFKTTKRNSVRYNEAADEMQEWDRKIYAAAPEAAKAAKAKEAVTEAQSDVGVMKSVTARLAGGMTPTAALTAAQVKAEALAKVVEGVKDPTTGKVTTPGLVQALEAAHIATKAEEKALVVAGEAVFLPTLERELAGLKVKLREAKAKGASKATKAPMEAEILAKEGEIKTAKSSIAYSGALTRLGTAKEAEEKVGQDYTDKHGELVKAREEAGELELQKKKYDEMTTRATGKITNVAEAENEVVKRTKAAEAAEKVAAAARPVEAIEQAKIARQRDVWMDSNPYAGKVFWDNKAKAVEAETKSAEARVNEAFAGTDIGEQFIARINQAETMSKAAEGFVDKIKQANLSEIFVKGATEITNILEEARLKGKKYSEKEWMTRLQQTGASASARMGYADELKKYYTGNAEIDKEKVYDAGSKAVMLEKKGEVEQDSAIKKGVEKGMDKFKGMEREQAASLAAKTIKHLLYKKKVNGKLDAQQETDLMASQTFLTKNGWLDDGIDNIYKLVEADARKLRTGSLKGEELEAAQHFQDVFIKDLKWGKMSASGDGTIEGTDHSGGDRSGDLNGLFALSGDSGLMMSESAVLAFQRANKSKGWGYKESNRQLATSLQAKLGARSGTNSVLDASGNFDAKKLEGLSDTEWQALAKEMNMEGEGADRELKNFAQTFLSGTENTQKAAGQAAERFLDQIKSHKAQYDYITGIKDLGLATSHVDDVGHVIYDTADEMTHRQLSDDAEKFVNGDWRKLSPQERMRRLKVHNYSRLNEKTGTMSDFSGVALDDTASGVSSLLDMKLMDARDKRSFAKLGADEIGQSITADDGDKALSIGSSQSVLSNKTFGNVKGDMKGKDGKRTHKKRSMYVMRDMAHDWAVALNHAPQLLLYSLGQESGVNFEDAMKGKMAIAVPDPANPGKQRTIRNVSQFIQWIEEVGVETDDLKDDDAFAGRHAKFESVGGNEDTIMNRLAACRQTKGDQNVDDD